MIGNLTSSETVSTNVISAVKPALVRVAGMADGRDSQSGSNVTARFAELVQPGGIAMRLEPVARLVEECPAEEPA
jgi:hypothetical protein